MTTTGVTTWLGTLWRHPESTQAPRAIDTIKTSLGKGETIGNPNHVREHGSILAGAEKKALIWMARRLPHWINSDHLTMLGFAAMLIAGVAYAAANRRPLALIFVVLALALNWFGDSLDGTLARVRNQLRPRYGFYVDHVLDMVGTFSLPGGLALSGYMNPLLALGMLAVSLTPSCESSWPSGPSIFSIDRGFAWEAWGCFGYSMWAAWWQLRAWG
jgi:hypothetical protein